MAVSRDADAAGTDRWAPALAWLLWALTLFGLAAILWLDHLMRRAGRPELTIRAHELTYVAALAGMATVGAVLAGRRPRHPVGWLMLALGLTVTVDGATDGYARYGLLASPGAVPGVRHLRTLGDTFALWPACIGFILLLTPTGRLPSPRWRWWAGIAVVAPLTWKAATVVGFETVGFPPFYSFPNPYFVPALAGPAMAVALPALAVTLLSVVVGGASLVVRFRRARGEERQQLRWVASAAVVAAVGIPVAVAGIAVGSPAVVGVAVLGSALVLCLAIAAAILRYRLYDIDRIISRTLAYALLTILLGLGYAAVVLGLGRLLPDSSSLAVAAATLAVAAAFQPARRRLQQAVDRRFNRRRHDAARIIQGFGGRLRDQVDLDTLTRELLTVVDQTMQPTQASLWLRPNDQPSQPPAVGGAGRMSATPPAADPLRRRLPYIPIVPTVTGGAAGARRRRAARLKAFAGHWRRQGAGPGLLKASGSVPEDLPGAGRSRSV